MMWHLWAGEPGCAGVWGKIRHGPAQPCPAEETGYAKLPHLLRTHRVYTSQRDLKASAGYTDAAGQGRCPRLSAW